MTSQTSKVKKRPIVYRHIPRVTGIRTIWDWSDATKKYVQRQTGKRYYAYKKLNKRQYTRCFESMDDAKKWWANPLMFDSGSPEASKDMLFRDLKERFLKHYFERVRISSYETFTSKIRHLTFFDGMQVREITPQVVDAWLNAVKQPSYLQSQHSSRLTYEDELTSLGQILGYYREYFCESDVYSSPIRKRHRADCIVNMERYLLSKANQKKRYLTRIRG
ncbi:MAG: hypothetical protein K2Q26_09015 [Bdellovibrionales bacterium]|nr:hypothetical protein [Bdellovibrionales bacterium]